MFAEYMYDIFLVLTLMLAGILVIVMLLLQFNRLINEGIHKKKKITQRKIEQFLSALVFEDSPIKAPENLKKIDDFRLEIPFDKTWCKELLIRNLIRLDGNFKGAVKDKVKDIYLHMGLYSYSLSLLESKTWYIKIKGIFQLQKMNCLSADKLLKKYTKSSHKHLRSAALIAYISLAQKEPLQVLDHYEEQISKIEELKIFQVIKSRKIQMPQNIENWLHSPNPSLVVLSLRLMGYYNHVPHLDTLRTLLYVQHIRIRKEAIILVRKLYLVDFEMDLVQIFEKEVDSNRVQIMKALGVIGGDFSIDFFQVILKVNISKEFNMLAMLGIKNVNASKLEEREFNTGELLMVKKHINDPLITW